MKEIAVDTESDRMTKEQTLGKGERNGEIAEERKETVSSRKTGAEEDNCLEITVFRLSVTLPTVLSIPVTHMMPPSDAPISCP